VTCFVIARSGRGRAWPRITHCSRAATKTKPPMNTDEHSAVQPQPKPISPRRRWSVKKIVAPASRRQVSLDNSLCVNSLCRLEAGPTFFSRDRRERAGRPWERTVPACSAFLTPRTQDACAPRRTHKNPLHAGKNFSADRKLFVILRVLRVFVVDWVRSLPRRREDAKNRQVLVAAQLLCVHRWFHFVAFMPLRIARELEFSPEAWGRA